MRQTSCDTVVVTLFARGAVGALEEVPDPAEILTCRTRDITEHRRGIGAGADDPAGSPEGPESRG